MVGDWRWGWGRGQAGRDWCPLLAVTRLNANSGRLRAVAFDANNFVLRPSCVYLCMLLIRPDGSTQGAEIIRQGLVSVDAYVPCPKDLISASSHFWDILAASAKMYTQGDAEVTAILFHDK